MKKAGSACALPALEAILAVCLEFNGARELQTAHGATGRQRSDLAGSGTLHVVVRPTEVGVVEGVGRLSTEREANFFGQSERLGQAEILLDEAGSKERTDRVVAESAASRK